MAGVHFFADDPAPLIAKKALRVNLSDLASKGAAPLGFLLALSLPADITPPWLADFAQGLGEDAAHFACPLVGGDTVRTAGPLTITITALGTVPAGRRLLRTQAQVGDRLYVSGTIGDAALGLHVRRGKAPALSAPHAQHLLTRYLQPEPRMSLAPAMRLAHAGMDISDGLVGDCAKMLQASGVAGVLDLRAVPLSPAGRAYPQGLEIAVTGGDDYELLTSVSQGAAAAFEAAADVPVTQIGSVTEGCGLTILGLDGQKTDFARKAYDHFA